MPSKTPPKPKEISGLGSKVDSGLLEAAVDAYLELEGAGTVSKSEIGRRLGLERAPEWLDSPLFLRKLDAARFTKEVNRLRGNKELVGLLDRILDVALIESMNRLLLNPESIPSSVLFSETLIKLVRLRSELAGSGGPKSPKEVWINIHQEINNVADPKLREKLANRILEDMNIGRKLLEVKSDETSDIVDVDAIQLPSEPTDGVHTALPESEGDHTGVAVWSDPASDE